MSLPKLFRLSALAAALLAPAPAAAQTPPPKPTDPAAPQAPAAKPALDEAGRALGAKADALAKEAQGLVDEYKLALDARIQKFAAENPTLKRLNKAGVFTLQAVLAGVSTEPLAGLRDIRGVYEDLDRLADSYVNQYGGVAKQTAEAQAVEYMRKIVKAQHAYREDDKDGNGILDYATTFQELANTGLIQIPPMKKGDQFIVVEGYRFRIVSADTLKWRGDAAPARADEGTIYLYADETGIIRAEKGKSAGPTSAPYQAPQKEGEKAAPK